MFFRTAWWKADPFGPEVRSFLGIVMDYAQIVPMNYFVGEIGK